MDGDETQVGTRPDPSPAAPATPPADAAHRASGDTPSAHRSLIASFLSFLWPGIGQAYRGRRRSALVQALPVLAVVIALAAAIALLGPMVVVAYLFSPTVAFVLMALIVALALLRSWSIAGALRPIARGRSRPVVLAWGGFLILGALVVHGWLGWTVYAFYHAGQVITGPISADVTPVAPPAASLRPGATPPSTLVPTPEAPATPEPPILPGAEGRVTILFVGVDNTHGSRQSLTDTLMVASFDPATRKVVMISIPRDTTHLPFYAGGEWRPRINSLMQYAVRHPDLYPDGPMGTLVNEVSFIVGVPIDYYAQIDIAGFTRLIDAVGGVDIDVLRPVDDPGYQFSPTEIGFHVDAGPHHFDGKYATAYVRSRHGSSDYERARRQQQVLLALRNKVNDPSTIVNLPALVDALSQIIRTDAPLDRMPEIVSIVQGSTSAETDRYVLSPPDFAHNFVNAQGEKTFQLVLDMDAVARLSVELFGDFSRYSEPTSDQQ